jgi:hypothetical protein
MLAGKRFFQTMYEQKGNLEIIGIAYFLRFTQHNVFSLIEGYRQVHWNTKERLLPLPYLFYRERNKSVSHTIEIRLKAILLVRAFRRFVVFK